MSDGDNATTSNGVQEPGPSDEMSMYKKDAFKVVTFQLVYDEDDLESDQAVKFKPEMAHQIFGESESIFGYRSLSIFINYLHNSSRCYLDIRSSGKINSSNGKAEDIPKAMNDWMPSNYTTSLEDFTGWIQNEEHDKMYGELLTTFTPKKASPRFPDIEATYKITKITTASEEFTDFHARFETYITWFIDAANFIDLEDDKWLFFYVYEEFEHPKFKKIYRTPVGFCTIYKFYAYPRNIRARVSQIFVLPSHQKLRIGTALYETVAKNLRAMEEVLDITVEEPTPTFLKMRDLEDCGLLHKEIIKKNIKYFATSSKIIFEMGRNLKIGKRQIQRIYDILGLYYASQEGPKHYNAKLDNIRSRIIADLEKESRPSKRLCNHPGLSQQKLKVDKKTEIEAEYRKYCDDVEPSVKYMEDKLESWLKRNECKD
ncbi:unnamed protein product [Ceutorhynchus assimilis]|uniref:histone acetyltransferase n=1 Tax=Ceutorhynchus assimilis TaxID=467358 RepID=A0A9N9MUR4_9CUCU|nr:unnamed protein product [Ceutorhynchus assimilis]